MSVIKVKFSNWWAKDINLSDFGPVFVNNPYFKKTNINIEISNDPDFIIYGTYGDFISAACLDNCKAIKILFITEPISADFMLFDYCIGFDPFSYGDRYCYYSDFLYSPGAHIKTISYYKTKELLRKKEDFCDFIYSYDGGDVSRKKYFYLLNSYKRVEAIGTYLNNQPDNHVVDFRTEGDVSKYDFQAKCKFSLCIQPTDKEWFANEKIMHVIKANSVPTFYGTEKNKEIINEDRVIFINDFKTDKDFLNRIKEIDSNDDSYCKIISTPLFTDEEYQERVIDNECRFINDIFVSKKKRLINDNKEETIKKRILAYKCSYDKEQKKKWIIV